MGHLLSSMIQAIGDPTPSWPVRWRCRDVWQRTASLRQSARNQPRLGWRADRRSPASRCRSGDGQWLCTLTVLAEVLRSTACRHSGRTCPAVDRGIFDRIFRFSKLWSI